MKRKNGFTIPELLAVIVIIGVLTVMSVGTYTSISKSVKEAELKEKIEYLKSKVMEYASDNNIERDTITVSTLIDLGYIEMDHPENAKQEKIDNPVTGGYLDCTNFTIVRDLDDYNITYDLEGSCLTADVESKSGEIKTSLYVLTNNGLKSLDEFKLSDKDIIIDDNKENNDNKNNNNSGSSIIGGLFGGLLEGILGNNANSILGGIFGGLKNIFSWLFPNAFATPVNSIYDIHPWAGSDVYLFVDFSDVSFNIKDNSVTYDVGGLSTSTKEGNICSKFNVNVDCANVIRVESVLLFNSLVSATVNTDYGYVTKKALVRIDKENPTIKIDYDQSYTSNSVPVYLTGEDGAGSGIAGYYFGKKASPTIDGFTTTGTYHVNENGKYYAATIDNVGNISEVKTINISSIDKDAPIGFINPSGRDDWSTSDFTFNFGCSSDTKAGCANKIVYSIYNNDTSSYIVQNVTVDEASTSYTVTTPNNTSLSSITLTYTIYDNVGNSSTKVETIHTRIDKVDHSSNNNSGGGNPGPNDENHACKGWEGLACVLAGAAAGGLGGAQLGGGIGAAIGAAAGALGGLLCVIFC